MSDLVRQRLLRRPEQRLRVQLYRLRRLQRLRLFRLFSVDGSVAVFCGSDAGAYFSVGVDFEDDFSAIGSGSSVFFCLTSSLHN